MTAHIFSHFSTLVVNLSLIHSLKFSIYSGLNILFLCVANTAILFMGMGEWLAEPAEALFGNRHLNQLLVGGTTLQGWTEEWSWASGGSPVSDAALHSSFPQRLYGNRRSGEAESNHKRLQHQLPIVGLHPLRNRSLGEADSAEGTGGSPPEAGLERAQAVGEARAPEVPQWAELGRPE